MISKEQWKIIEPLFEQALDINANEQEEFLRAHCNNEQIINEVLGLLLAEKHTPVALEQPAINFIDQNPFQTKNISLTGMKIGPYQLENEIGRGGMGVVYHANRIDGEFQQQVAVKLLNPEKHKKSDFQRFQREQQCLASLEHSNIARLLDGGLTDEGYPYIVMEYLEGDSLDNYCTRMNLSVKEIIELFITIADALAYAHKKLIVHRDIKPANILVTNNGEVKLLDFGIAKLLDEDMFSAFNTNTVDKMFTPGFASPEQLLGHPVTVETDIYQFGLVMYKVLTGHYAFSDQASTVLEVIKSVTQQLPTRPSDIVLHHSEEPTSNAKVKSSQFRGDIDAIVLKCLVPVADERYASMESLKYDLDAYLDCIPIVARNPTYYYLSKLFLRRNWTWISFSVLSFLAFVFYVVTITIQIDRVNLALDISNREKAKAVQISDFMIDMFKSADPNVSGLNELTASQLLKSGSEKLLKQMEGSEQIQSNLLTVIGEVYFSQGDYENSASILKSALKLHRTSTEPDLSSIANTLTQLGISYANSSQLEKAKAVLEESLAIHNQLNLDNSKHKTFDQAETHIGYGQLLRKLGLFQKALQHYKKSITILNEIYPKGHPELSVALNGMASVNVAMGEYTEAKIQMEQAIGIHEKLLNYEHSYYSIYLNNFSLLLIKMELYDEALSYSKKALDVQSKTLKKNHPYFAATLRSAALIEYYRGRLDVALNYLEKAIDINSNSLKKSNYVTTILYDRLGNVFLAMGDYHKAEHYFKMAHDNNTMLATKSAVLGKSLSKLALMDFLHSRFADAEKKFIETMTLLPNNTLPLAETKLDYVRLLLQQNRKSEAEKLAHQALNTRLVKLPKGHSAIYEAEGLLGLSIMTKDRKTFSLDLMKRALVNLNNYPLFKKSYRKQYLNQLKQRIDQFDSISIDSAVEYGQRSR